MSKTSTVIVLTTRLGPLPLGVSFGLKKDGFNPIILLMQGTASGGLITAARAYGWHYILAQGIDNAWRRGWTYLNARAMRGIQVIRIASRDWSTLEEVALRHSAAAIISVSFKYKIPAQIIEGKTLLLNLHPAPLPDWRGADPIWWMRRVQTSKFGATLHRVSEGIDEGDVLFTLELPPRRHHTQAAIECAIASILRSHIGRWMEAILEGHAKAVPQVGGRYWPLPTLKNVRAFKANGVP